MKKSNKYRTVMNCSFRVLSKVFITIVNEIIYKKSKTIKKYKILSSSLIEKLKTSFSDYKKEINSNKIEVKNNCIDYLLNLTFGDFLKSAGFPFKDENCSIKLPDLITNILNGILNENNEYEKKIIDSLKENKIFLDELKGNKKDKSKKKEKKKEPKNNYYDILFNRGNNKLFIKFLQQKCSVIINIIFSEDKQQAIDKFLNKKRIFLIIKSNEKSNIKMEGNINPTNDDNIDIFKENNFNDKNEQHNTYPENEQKEKFYNNSTNFTTMNKEITSKYELPRQDKIEIYVIGDQISFDGILLKNYNNIDLNEFIQQSYK